MVNVAVMVNDDTIKAWKAEEDSMANKDISQPPGTFTDISRSLYEKGLKVNHEEHRMHSSHFCLIEGSIF